MPPSSNITAPDAVMPDSSIAEAERATLDARNAIESEHMDEDTIDPSDQMADVFAANPAPSNPSDPPNNHQDESTVDIDYDTNANSADNMVDVPEATEHTDQAHLNDHAGNPDQVAHHEQPEQHEEQHQPESKEDPDELGQHEEPEQLLQHHEPVHADQPDEHEDPEQLEESEQHMVPEQPDQQEHHEEAEQAEQLEQPAQQQHTEHVEPSTISLPSGGATSHSSLQNEKPGENISNQAAVATAAAAEAVKAAVAANVMSAAALAAAAVSSPVATTTVPALPLASGIAPAGPAGYAAFASLAPNGTPLMAHPILSVPMPIGRRAVRIAPMGVLPLPPQGGGLMGDIGGGGGVGGGDGGIGGIGGVGMVDVVLGGGAAGTIGEMPKGKRRGVSGTAPVSTEGMSQEERTKQKRMLRNRESAARSRDKRKTKNIQLEASIEIYKKKTAVIEEVMVDLQEAVDSMQQILKKHKISVPC